MSVIFRQFSLIILLLCSQSLPAQTKWVRSMMEDFQDSDFIFERSDSEVPFIPLAYAGWSQYGDARLGNTDLEYDISRFTQAAALPILIGQRDAIFVGDYLSYSEFRSHDGSVDFNVTTLGLPVAWLRQANPDWQVAAFVMPMGHYSRKSGDDWMWEYMGGAFARYVQTDSLWWAFGLYLDIEPGDDDLILPYFGASWQINEHWNLSAMMPWPSIQYSPTRDWLLRLGLAPSGVSWNIRPDDYEATLNLDAWDFGLEVDRRLVDNIWVGLELGVGGFRSLHFADGRFEGADLDAGKSPYISLDFEFRPEAL